MVSLDQYLDSQAAQAAADVIKIYKADFADSMLKDPRTPVQKFRDLEKLAEAYKKKGTKGFEDEILKQMQSIGKEEELPIWYYLAHNSKDVTFSLLKKLGIKDCQAFKEEVIRYCKSEDERPTVLNDLDDKLLESHFNSYFTSMRRIKFNLAIKKAKFKIRKIIRKHYNDLLELVKTGTRELEAIDWQGSIIKYCWAVDQEISVLRNKFAALPWHTKIKSGFKKL